MKAAVDGMSKGVRERSLADARNVFDKQVPAGEKAHQREPHHFRLAADCRFQSRFELR
jgi:hypothetical protein